MFKKMNEHFNKHTKKYRFKTYNQNTQERCKDEKTSNKNRAGFINKVNGVEYIYVIHKYKPYWFFEILWHIINWHKQPKLKAINNHPIISKFIKYWWLFIVTILAGIVLIMIERGIIDIGI